MLVNKKKGVGDSKPRTRAPTRLKLQVCRLSC